MNQFTRLMEGIPVDAVIDQLDAHSELWNAHPDRLAENGPHAGCSDIWVRYKPLAALTGHRDFDEPHFAEFYPAWRALPALRPIVFGLMGMMEATYLGGILITRIPPGQSVKPHADAGWHATTMNCKIWVPLRANEDCINRCGDDAVVMRPGEAWMFDNAVTHSVENNGQTDRDCLIVTMKVEP